MKKEVVGVFEKRGKFKIFRKPFYVMTNLIQTVPRVDL